MLFTDEEARHKFHQSATFLQMICTILDNDMAKHHIQLELIDTEHDEERKLTFAHLVVHGHEFDEDASQQKAFKEIARAVRDRFKGKIFIEPGNYGLITVQLKDEDITDPPLN